MEEQFTKGTWNVSSVGNRYGTGEIFEIHWSKDGECVAEIVHNKADALLMASSKDLYMALMKISSGISSDALGTTAMSREEMMEIANSAILKATTGE